jgi:hypothetical protein
MTTNVDIPSAPRVEIAPRREAVADETDVRYDSPRWRAAPMLVATLISVAYLFVQPKTVDLAASTFRANLFGADGFVIWNNAWYSGHPTWSYSVLVPPLAWLLSPALLAALSTVLSAALFGPLARGWFGARAAGWGAIWFGAGVATPMLSGRVTFAAGVTVALATLLAVQRGRPWLGGVLAVLCGLTSPVAGLFLALATFAHALTGARRAGLALTAAALAPLAAASLVFPDGGKAPFALSAFWPLPLFSLAFCLALPARERALRAGALLYALGTVGGVVIPNALGGNVVRLGALVGGPLLLCALLATRRRIGVPVVALLVAFAGWQWSAAVRDIAHGSGEPATKASFYKPLNDFLGRARNAGGEPFRVEIPFTFSHWETADVSPRFPLTRGWLRGDDVQYNHLFYGGVLNAATFRAWLSEHAVRFVAVAHAKPDYSARAELRLIASGLPYLRPVWSSRDWRVYEVTAPHAMALGAQVLSLGGDDVRLRFAAAGSAIVRVRWTPYWRAPGACVERAGEWTRVVASRAGDIRLATSFAPGRVLDHGRRCA